MAGFLFPACAVNSNLIKVLPYTFNGASCYLLCNAGLFSVANEDLKTKIVSMSKQCFLLKTGCRSGC